jgi:methylglyoxal synthase
MFRDNRKYLALIAHNEMKKSLADFVKLHVDDIGRFPLVATGTTGMMLYKETGLVLGKKVASGPLGGDQAIGTMVSTDNICGIIFFRDPLSAHPHHADIEALGRLCDVYQVPFATNPGTAEAILKYLRSGDVHVSIANQVLDNYRRGQKKVLSSP